MKLEKRIMGSLRNIARYSPENKLCLELAKSPQDKGPRGGAMFFCKKCGLAFKRTDVQIDHIDPVIPTHLTLNEMDWNTIISRLFCKLINLQVLCKGCHQLKCNEEKIERLNNGI